MIMSPDGARYQNDCAVEGQLQFTGLDRTFLTVSSYRGKQIPASPQEF
jgi:hypothetical protein